MSMVTEVVVLKVQQDAREPYTGSNAAGRAYEIVSFVGDGKLYAGSAGVNAALDGTPPDNLVEGLDFCSVTDYNVSKFKTSNDDVFPVICNLRRGQVVRVTIEREHVIGNQRKVWRDNVVSVELVADAPMSFKGLRSRRVAEPAEVKS